MSLDSDRRRKTKIKTKNGGNDQMTEKGDGFVIRQHQTAKLFTDISPALKNNLALQSSVDPIEWMGLCGSTRSAANPQTK
jgi:hypothetical protein